jgi:DNA polymerase V
MQDMQAVKIPLLGFVEAGWPSPAEEELSDSMSLDEYLISNREATFILKVGNDAMSGAGILAGDIALVERRGEARAGDIVVAEVDGAWVMRYLRCAGGKTFLESANDKFQKIFPEQSLKIAAVVRAVVRRY